MQALQLARIEESMKRVDVLVFERDPIAEGWSLRVAQGRQTFDVHGTSLVDVLAQAAQVIEVR